LFLSAQNITINSNGTIVNSGAITSQDDTHITASNITNQNGVMTGNNIRSVVFCWVAMLRLFAVMSRLLAVMLLAVLVISWALMLTLPPCRFEALPTL
jgi:adhesin HecA-like repeat protein